MWAGPLHDQEFVKELRRTVDKLDENVYKMRTRMIGMLTLAVEVCHLTTGLIVGTGRSVLSNSTRTRKDCENGNSTPRYSMVSPYKCRIQSFCNTL